MPNIISPHDVFEPLKQALLALRDVIISQRPGWGGSKRTER